MPSVTDNDKFRCNNCGTVQTLNMEAGEVADAPPCRSCGVINWDQLVITKVCDFCSQPETELPWVYPCHDFSAMIGAETPSGISIAPTAQGSKGPWAACVPCHDLIEADDWEGLADRAARLSPGMSDLSPEIRKLVRDAQKQLHQAFNAHRKLIAGAKAPPYREGELDWSSNA